MGVPEGPTAPRLPGAGPVAPDGHRIRLAERTIEYALRRSPRRRSISMTIDDRGLRVGAPLRATQSRIEAALRAHGAWILRKLDEWAARRPAPFAWSAGARVMYLGEALTLVPDPACAGVLRAASELRVRARADDAAALAQAVLAWLHDAARGWFAARVAHFAPVLAVAPPVIRLSNARTRWGTCHPHGRVHLNWRLIHMPPPLVDYVVVHELAHLHEANHSPRFWRHVAAVLPDHAQRRLALRRDAHRYLLP